MAHGRRKAFPTCCVPCGAALENRRRKAVAVASSSKEQTKAVQTGLETSRAQRMKRKTSLNEPNIRRSGNACVRGNWDASIFHIHTHIRFFTQQKRSKLSMPNGPRSVHGRRMAFLPLSKKGCILNKLFAMIRQPYS